MPTTVKGSTVPRRQLGRELRRLREEEARIAQVDAAKALDCSVKPGSGDWSAANCRSASWT